MEDPLTPAEALVGIGMCATYADGAMDAAEDEEFQDTILGYNVLRDLDEDDLRAAIMKVDEISRKHGDASLIARAAAALPENMRATAYYLAVDLARADGRLDTEELAFLQGLQRQLRVPDETASQILEVVSLFYQD